MPSLKELGFIRAGAAVPKLEIANPTFNRQQIINFIVKASSEQVQVLLFPELSMTGYSNGDLFNQPLLLQAGEKELSYLLQETKELDMVIIVGMPIPADNQLFNCAVVFSHGRILGVVPKTFIPNYNEFYEKRWFASSINRISEGISLCGQSVPFNEWLLFKDAGSELVIGIEICEDLWAPIPPSSYHAQYGANMILNLSASNESVGKTEYRRNLVKGQSARCMAAYLYASAGPGESTTDVVFGGHAMIAENGILLQEDWMNFDGTLLIEDIDIEKLMNDRRKFNSFMGRVDEHKYNVVYFQLNNTVNGLRRRVDPQPFVPFNKRNRSKRCSDIFNIQAAGLAQRLEKTGINKAVLGISGGLDSTLALLVSCQAYNQLKRPLENIIGVSMPGFGTSIRTYNNSIASCGRWE